MSPNGYAFLGMTAIVAALVSLLVFVTVRLFAAARSTRSSLRGSGGDTALLASALEDAVTKLKAQERAMSARAEASERLSGQIIASLTSGLLVVGLGGDVRIINPAGRRLLGLEDDEVFTNYRQLPAHAAPLAAVIDECLTGREPIVRRALKLSGSASGGPSKPGGPSKLGPYVTPPALHLGVTVSPLFDESGELHGAICLFTDLTAVFDLEDQVRLKDSLARVGELTAGIAHEFRNGLATIHGYSRLINLETLSPTDRPYVEGIRAETHALGQVVTNFLNFAKPTQLSLAPVDLQVIAQRTADDLRAEATARGGDITVSGTFATIDGDDVLLRQAFSNLLRNAIEACAGSATPPKVSVEASVDRALRVCRISVNDNGPGIEPAVRDRIFRPFFTTKANGTGLGLALVLKIIVTHNGRVTIGTSPLGGASLQITLPLPPA
jgi:two-component system sensor histidine kinase HydH